DRLAVGGDHAHGEVLRHGGPGPDRGVVRLPVLDGHAIVVRGVGHAGGAVRVHRQVVAVGLVELLRLVRLDRDVAAADRGPRAETGERAVVGAVEREGPVPDQLGVDAAVGRVVDDRGGRGVQVVAHLCTLGVGGDRELV